MTLNELTPTSLTSLIERNWRASLPASVVALSLVVGAFFVPLPYGGLLIAVAAVAWVIVDRWLVYFRHRQRVRRSRRRPDDLPEAPPFDAGVRMGVLRPLFADRPVSSFVLFSFGTFVTLSGRSDDPVAEAKAILDRHGHPVVGTPSADTLTYELPTGDFIVGCYHPFIFTFVTRECFPDDVRASLGGRKTANTAAMIGRGIRDMDSFALNVVYSETVGQGASPEASLPE